MKQKKNYKFMRATSSIGFLLCLFFLCVGGYRELNLGCNFLSVVYRFSLVTIIPGFVCIWYYFHNNAEDFVKPFKEYIGKIISSSNPAYELFIQTKDGFSSDTVKRVLKDNGDPVFKRTVCALYIASNSPYEDITELLGEDDEDNTFKQAFDNREKYISTGDETPREKIEIASEVLSSLYKGYIDSWISDASK